MQPNSKKTKQRRHIRYAIELKAVLIASKSERFDCLILDFCSHGIFLRITQANSETPLPKQVKIQFTLPSELGKQAFEIDAELMHRSPNGIGVMIDNMPLAAFNALKAQTTQGMSVTGGSDSDNKPLVYDSFKLFLKQNLVEHLAGLTGNFFETIHENLQNTNVHSEYFASLSELDDLITTLKLNVDTFTSEFCHSVIDQIDSITEHNPKKEDITHFDRPLSLVEKEDFEDWLNMSVIIRKLSNYYEESINQVTRELSRILGRSKTTINNPVNPAVLCDCFREIVLQFKLDIKINKALYICFGKTLFEALPGFYQQVSACLSPLRSAENKFGDAAPQSPRNSVVERSASSSEFFLDAHKVPLLQGKPKLEHSDHQSLSHITGKLLDLLKDVDLSRNELSQPDSYDNTENTFAQPIDYFDHNEITTAISQLQNDPAAKLLHQDHAHLKDHLQQTLTQV